MGSSQSRGGLRRQLRPLVPRAWPELEQLRVRFQQEARRRRSDPELQFFLSAPVFCAIAAPLVPDMGKTELLALFAALDRKRRGRIAAIDFFSGLALVVDAKKAQKLDFLMSLVDNGGCKTLNRCELTIVLSAAARGLAMFTLLPEPHRDMMKPLVRRLMGELSEIPRQSVTDKALVDPEILFFMNDLEGRAGSSEELLIQQGKLLCNMAFLDLRVARVEMSGLPVEPSVSMSVSATQSSALGSKSRAHTSIDVLIRKLQNLVCPAQPIARGTGSSKDSITSLSTPGEVGPVINPSDAKKRVDVRTLQRLVHRISGSYLFIPDAEAACLIEKMPVDQFGFVRCGEIVRTMSSWLQANWHDEQVPFWGIAARFIVTNIHRIVNVMSGALNTITSRKISRDKGVYPSKSSSSIESPNHDTNDSELNWSANLRVGGTSRPTEGSDMDHTNKRESIDAIRFRVGLHPPETADADDFEGDDLDGDDSGMRLILRLTLREDTNIETAMELASAVEQLLEHEDVLDTFPSVWRACRVSVGSSSRNDILPHHQYKQLQVSLALTRDWFDELEECTDVSVFDHIQKLFVLGEITNSVKSVVNAALEVARSLDELTKPEHRLALLRSEFERFDIDKSGDWNVQEFNTFQQSIGREALTEEDVKEILHSDPNAISFESFAELYRNCTAAEMIQLFQQLQTGSLNRLLKGSISVNCVLHQSMLWELAEKLLSPLRWGDSTLKRLFFVCQSTGDLSYDLNCPTLVDALRLFGISIPSFLTNSRFIGTCVETLQELLRQPHAEHTRDQHCRSLQCSLSGEVDKNGSRDGTAMEHGEPVTSTCLRALKLATQSIVGPEMVELRGKPARLILEVDNLVVEGFSNQDV